MTDENGKVIGGVLVFRDISERRKAEADLTAAYKRLEMQAAELRRSNEDLSQLAYVASHDLRSPLNTILQFTQLLERKYGAQLGEGKSLLNFVTNAASRMSRLIEDLLRYARVSSEMPTIPEPIDATLPLQEAIENLQGVAEESGATITREAMPWVAADKTSLVQIFQNLIGNAIHYRGTSAPRIHLSAKELDREWLFSCKDNGIGIPVEYQATIFAPFKRLHGVDRPGSGIGLAVCKKLVERHNGTIWVESVEGQGSTFSFTIPKALRLSSTLSISRG
jgi:signal transduction histidine kinase